MIVVRIVSGGLIAQTMMKDMKYVPIIQEKRNKKMSKCETCKYGYEITCKSGNKYFVCSERIKCEERNKKYDNQVH